MSGLASVLDECRSIDNEYHYFTRLFSEQEISKNQGPLSELYITVKDLICVSGIETTASSDILSNYVPEFDATAIRRLKKAGANIIGKTVCDEFGFGSFGINVGKRYKIPLNPHNKERVTGGSSSGAGGISSKASFRHVALSTSTGGSTEAPASFCGVIGFCPTYGRISRYGLISYADSLDKICLMSKSLADLEKVYNAISGFDENDPTTLIENAKLNKTSKKKLKIGIIKESVGRAGGVDKQILTLLIDYANNLGFDADISEASLPITIKYGIPTYYIIAMAEASTNLARYKGQLFGLQEDCAGANYNDYFKRIRNGGFCDESKRRIMIGTFIRSAGYRNAYYIKAAKIRTLIINEYKKLFADFDILISPTMPTVAPKISDANKMSPAQNYAMDILTVGPNLAGVPHISVPIGKINGMPVGLMAIADHLNDNLLFDFVSKLRLDI